MSKSTKNTTIVLTNQQSFSELGISAAQDYQQVATLRGSPFISIILYYCELEENLKRLSETRRGGEQNINLLDPKILRGIRETEDLYHFADNLEKDIDVTNILPLEAARQILDFTDTKHD